MPEAWGIKRERQTSTVPSLLSPALFSESRSCAEDPRRAVLTTAGLRDPHRGSGAKGAYQRGLSVTIC